MYWVVTLQMAEDRSSAHRWKFRAFEIIGAIGKISSESSRAATVYEMENLTEMAMSDELCDCVQPEVHPFYAVTGDSGRCIPGDHRRTTRAATKPDRANINRGRADFPFELPLNAASSAAYGFLPRLSSPGEPGPELRPSPSCDVIGFQWR
jgi:hypothetical protein